MSGGTVGNGPANRHCSILERSIGRGAAELRAHAAARKVKAEKKDLEAQAKAMKKAVAFGDVRLKAKGFDGGYNLLREFYKAPRAKAKCSLDSLGIFELQLGQVEEGGRPVYKKRGKEEYFSYRKRCTDKFCRDGHYVYEWVMGPKVGKAAIGG